MISKALFEQIPDDDWRKETWIAPEDAGSKTKAVRVPLSVGRQNPQQYEITEGLRPGDWVITTGYDTFGDAEELILR